MTLPLRFSEVQDSEETCSECGGPGPLNSEGLCSACAGKERQASVRPSTWVTAGNLEPQILQKLEEVDQKLDMIAGDGEPLEDILRHDQGHDHWHAQYGDEPCTSEEDCAQKRSKYDAMDAAGMGKEANGPTGHGWPAQAIQHALTPAQQAANRGHALKEVALGLGATGLAAGTAYVVNKVRNRQQTAPRTYAEDPQIAETRKALGEFDFEHQLRQIGLDTEPEQTPQHPQYSLESHGNKWGPAFNKQSSWIVRADSAANAEHSDDPSGVGYEGPLFGTAESGSPGGESAGSTFLGGKYFKVVAASGMMTNSGLNPTAPVTPTAPMGQVNPAANPVDPSTETEPASVTNQKQQMLSFHRFADADSLPAMQDGHWLGGEGSDRIALVGMGNGGASDGADPASVGDGDVMRWGSVGYNESLTKKATDSDLYFQGYWDARENKKLDEVIAAVSDDYIHGYNDGKIYRMTPTQSAPPNRTHVHVPIKMASCVECNGIKVAACAQESCIDDEGNTKIGSRCLNCNGSGNVCYDCGGEIRFTAARIGDEYDADPNDDPADRTSIVNFNLDTPEVRGADEMFDPLSLDVCACGDPNCVHGKSTPSDIGCLACGAADQPLKCGNCDSKEFDPIQGCASCGEEGTQGVCANGCSKKLQTRPGVEHKAVEDDTTPILRGVDSFSFGRGTSRIKFNRGKS